MLENYLYYFAKIGYETDQFCILQESKGKFLCQVIPSQLDTAIAQLTVDPKFKHGGILGPHYT